jgi:hypothetical protein
MALVFIEFRLGKAEGAVLLQGQHLGSIPALHVSVMPSSCIVEWHPSLRLSTALLFAMFLNNSQMFMLV